MKPHWLRTTGVSDAALSGSLSPPTFSSFSLAFLTQHPLPVLWFRPSDEAYLKEVRSSATKQRALISEYITHLFPTFFLSTWRELGSAAVSL